jgi:hypothetical protein
MIKTIIEPYIVHWRIQQAVNCTQHQVISRIYQPMVGSSSC